MADVVACGGGMRPVAALAVLVCLVVALVRLVARHNAHVPFRHSDTVAAEARKRADLAIRHASTAALALVGGADLPDLRGLEQVYWKQRVGASLAALPWGHPQPAQYPFQGAWPCLWGEAPAELDPQPDSPNEWKYTCGLRRVRSPRCVVYSIGSWQEMTFERGVKAVRPDCEVHVIDHPLFQVPHAQAKKANVTLHPYWISDQQGSEWVTVTCYPPFAFCGGPPKRIQVTYITLVELMRRNGHDHIDVLKMDAEGAEYRVLNALPGSVLERIGAVNIEVHGWQRTAEAIAPLENAGFRIFHAEENFRRVGMFEYALVKNTWHPDQFRTREVAP